MTTLTKTMTIVDRAVFKAAAKEIRREESKYDQRWWGTRPDDMEDGEAILPMDLETWHVHCTSTACLAGLGALLGGYRLLAYEGDDTIEDCLTPDSPFEIDEHGYLGEECIKTSVSYAGMSVYFPGIGDVPYDSGWYEVAESMFNSDWAQITLRERGKLGIAAILEKIGRTKSDEKAFDIISRHSAHREYNEGIEL